MSKKRGKEIKKFDIFFADLGQTIGSEQAGKRPVLIVQNDIGNKYSTTTIVLPLTKRIEKNRKLPVHIPIDAIGRKIKKGTIMAEQIRAIDKKRLLYFVVKLPIEYREKVRKAMKIATNLDNWRENYDKKI